MTTNWKKCTQCAQPYIVVMPNAPGVCPTCRFIEVMGAKTLAEAQKIAAKRYSGAAALARAAKE